MFLLSEVSNFWDESGQFWQSQWNKFLEITGKLKFILYSDCFFFRFFKRCGKSIYFFVFLKKYPVD
jgi:hypothetical protein